MRTYLNKMFVCVRGRWCHFFLYYLFTLTLAAVGAARAAVAGRRVPLEMMPLDIMFRELFYPSFPALDKHSHAN